MTDLFSDGFISGGVLPYLTRAYNGADYAGPLKPTVRQTGREEITEMADLISQLTQLAQLKNDGVLSKEEFQAAKAKLFGTATSVTSASPQRRQREICTVEYVHVKSRWNSSDSQFRAVATGPSGRYIVAQSPVWNDSNGRSEKENLKRYHAALEAVLKDLSAREWQVVEQFGLPRYASANALLPIYTYERYI